MNDPVKYIGILLLVSEVAVVANSVHPHRIPWVQDWSRYVVTEGHCLYIGDANYGSLGGYELEIAKVYFRVLAAESFATLGLLERFAKKATDSVWKKDRKTLFQALENGDSADDILAVLQAGTANEIPQTVRSLIDETVARSGSATQREDAVAITFRDEHTAVLAEHDATIRPAVFCRHGNTLFVRAKNLKKFQGGLRKLGILLP